MIKRPLLKRCCLALLDTVAEEHPLGHQEGKAARYILKSDAGAVIELMFEKDSKSYANLWCLEKAAAPLIRGSVDTTPSPARTVNSGRNVKGEPVYGRHSALKGMPQLGMANLTKFRIESLADLGAVLDHLLSLEPREVT